MDLAITLLLFFGVFFHGHVLQRLGLITHPEAVIEWADRLYSRLTNGKDHPNYLRARYPRHFELYLARRFPRQYQAFLRAPIKEGFLTYLRWNHLEDYLEVTQKGTLVKNPIVRN